MAYLTSRLLETTLARVQNPEHSLIYFFFPAVSLVTVRRQYPAVLYGISYFSQFRPPRKHTASQLQRSVGLCLDGTSEHGNEPSGSIKGREFL
jgi:hypothetical protein